MGLKRGTVMLNDFSDEWKNIYLQEEKLLKKLLKKYILEIEHIYYSYDMGYTKSDKEAYQIIINDLKVMPNEILHIGDSYMNDYLIPRENGFEVLFYGNNKNVINKIDNLSDIYDFLKKEKTFLKEV